MSLAPEMINGLFAVGGALVGAIVTGVFAIYIARTSKEKREIVISTTPPSKLLSVHDQIASKTEIFVSGEKVESATLTDIVISNTGNKAIPDLSFPISCQPGCKIISISIIKDSECEPNVVTMISKLEDSSFFVNVDYINPGEVLSFRCLATGSDPSWSVGIRQQELSVIRREMAEERYSDALVEALSTTLNSVSLLGIYVDLFNPALKILFRKSRNR